MSALRHNLQKIAIYGAVSLLIILSACTPLPPLTPLAAERVAVTAANAGPCEACDRATLAAMIQDQNASDIQAVATAEILRANAQATLNSASATLNAVQTQEQNNADSIAARIAATAELERADAKSTLVAAGSTQSAALTRDVILQTQVENNLQVTEDLATQNAISLDTQQQLEKQRLVPITFLWMWCLPIFILLLAGLVLWGVWRWLKINQANQKILGRISKKPRAPMIEDFHHHRADSQSYIDHEVGNSRNYFPKPEADQTGRWLDEVKRKLIMGDKKDENDDGY
ncbi:hypothetical protein KQH40_01465 [bacterium]|nr:hypothetical protein [bacterium]